MLTAVLAVRNIGGENFDLWAVNLEADYHEAGAEIDEQQLDTMRATQPLVPRRLASA